MNTYKTNCNKSKSLKRMGFNAILLSLILLFLNCKKDSVDATSTQTFQMSINDMASSLNTLQQVKFNEALYILKTFGVEEEGDYNEITALGKLINGKKVPEVLSLADQIAQKNGIDWSSTGPPSLGEMNIFGSTEAKESDPNDIVAQSLNVNVSINGTDEIFGAQSLQVLPRLVDDAGAVVVFSGAGLETVMEVFSGGNRILTAKNLMTDNNFKGFNLRFASLPAQKIIDEKIDITITVKTSKKTFKMSKIGQQVNPKALQMPSVDPLENVSDDPNHPTGLPNIDGASETNTDLSVTSKSDPKSSVTKFLNNLSSQNLRGAYDTADNPNWESYEKFSNPTSGFGGVKNINVKNISTNNASGNNASVNATYDITDKNGNVTAIQVTFGLKNINGDWKISSYKIN